MEESNKFKRSEKYKKDATQPADEDSSKTLFPEVTPSLHLRDQPANHSGIFAFLSSNVHTLIAMHGTQRRSLPRNV